MDNNIYKKLIKYISLPYPYFTFLRIIVPSYHTVTGTYTLNRMPAS